MTTPLDLTSPRDLLEQSRSIAFGDWIRTAEQTDLGTLSTALESMASQCRSELAMRAWRSDPRVYRSVEWRSEEARP